MFRSALVRQAFFAATLVAAVGATHASGPTAAGRWLQVSDTDGKPRSILRIDEHDGIYEAVVEKIFLKPGEDADPVCDKCTDTRKGQRVAGMRIMNGLRREGLIYEGGQILDPDNGKVYQAKAKLSADGQSLEVRGFIGISLIGRSQIWKREN